MADQIGITPQKADLVLSTGGDFQWSFVWKDGDFPTGSALYLLVGSSEKWDFTINGDIATIKIESEVADLVAANTPYRMVFKRDTTPTTETVICHGKVKRIP